MAHIIRQVTVARDGMHNAFTDLQFWQGCYWVGYRKGASHASLDGEAVIAVSADRARFREVAHLKVPGDNRDPKLLPLGPDRMAAYWPSWTRGAAARALQHYISFSGNGYTWSSPEPILSPSMWLWRIRPHEGRYYGLIQNLAERTSEGGMKHNLDLAVSDDLMSWEIMCRVGSDEQSLCESDIHWFPDTGEAWIVARSAARREGSFFCCAQPPYTDWDITELPAMIHAPVFVWHDDALYVAGRSRPAVEGDHTFPFNGASLGLWRVTRGAVEPVLRIPATGDCSYPGLIKDPDGRLCLTYYSQHAYHLGVVAPPSRRGLETDLVADDVYFAELALP